MLLRLTFCAGIALALAFPGQAQNTDPARFATERDSLFRRAAVIRSQTDARIGFFKTSFVALAGTRRCTKSYTSFPAAVAATGASQSPQALAKKHIVKFKRVGTRVEKVYYYTPQGNVALTEYYQDGELVRLEAADYYEIDPKDRVKVVKTEAGNYTTVTSKASGRSPVKEVKFLRGDYLEKTTRKSILPSKRVTKEYFAAPRPQA